MTLMTWNIKFHISHQQKQLKANNHDRNYSCETVLNIRIQKNSQFNARQSLHLPKQNTKPTTKLQKPRTERTFIVPSTTGWFFKSVTKMPQNCPKNAPKMPQKDQKWAF